jgi:hypothetical protein
LFKPLNAEYEITDKYILGKEVDGVNLKEENPETILKYLENRYKTTGKICIATDPSTVPSNLEKILLEQDYKLDETRDDVWWFLNLENYTNTAVYNRVNLIEAKTIQELNSLIQIQTYIGGKKCLVVASRANLKKL